MTRAILAAAALAAAACGPPQPEETEAGAPRAEPPAEGLAALEAPPAPTPGDWDETPLTEARAVFNQACRDRDMDSALCGCILDKLRAELGPDAAFAAGVTFGGRADLAREVAARLTELERMTAAEAYLEANRACLAEA